MEVVIVKVKVQIEKRGNKENYVDIKNIKININYLVSINNFFNNKNKRKIGLKIAQKEQI